MYIICIYMYIYVCVYVCSQVSGPKHVHTHFPRNAAPCNLTPKSSPHLHPCSQQLQSTSPGQEDHPAHKMISQVP